MLNIALFCGVGFATGKISVDNPVVDIDGDAMTRCVYSVVWLPMICRML